MWTTITALVRSLMSASTASTGRAAARSTDSTSAKHRPPATPVRPTCASATKPTAGHDHLVSRPDPGGQAGEMQGSGAARDRDSRGLIRLATRRTRRSSSCGPGSHRQPVAAQGVRAMPRSSGSESADRRRAEAASRHPATFPIDVQRRPSTTRVLLRGRHVREQRDREEALGHALGPRQRGDRRTPRSYAVEQVDGRVHGRLHPVVVARGAYASPAGRPHRVGQDPHQVAGRAIEIDVRVGDLENVLGVGEQLAVARDDGAALDQRRLEPVKPRKQEQAARGSSNR